MAMDGLTKLGIALSGFIVLRPNLEARIAATTSCGENKLWSSQNLHQQLRLLENLVPKVCYPSASFCVGLQVIHIQNQASARAWIDAFFFRASAMLPPDRCIILSMKWIVPAIAMSPMIVATISELVDYSAAVASSGTAGLKSALTHLDHLAHCSS